MKRRRIWVVAIFTILIQILFSSCGNTSQDYSAQIAVAQKNVPFKILVPTYLPPEMKGLPLSIAGPDKGEFPDSIWIGITYFKKGQNDIIVIDEENHLITQNPGSSKFTYFDINGIRVLEQANAVEIPSSASPTGGPNIVDSYLYGWNQNDIHITVEISGQDTASYRKMIESMINLN